MSGVEDLEKHILEKFDIVQLLGKGAYGVVFRAVDRTTKQEVAIKKVFDAFHNSTDAQRTYREVIFLNQLKGHDSIVKLLNVIEAKNPNDLYLVFEFLETDLHAVIRGDILEDIHKQFIIYQILKGLKYIHSADIIHRDLKPSNILLNSDCVVKIADFGLARSVSSSEDDANQILTEYIATRWYRAPEIVLGSQKYTKAIDVWSVGCIMAEMVTGKALFPGKSTLNQVELILELLGRPTPEDVQSLDSPLAANLLAGINVQKKKSFTTLFSKAGKDALDLIRRMLSFNPNKRITVDEALSHPYLRAFHSPADESVCPSKAKTPLDDNIKLSRGEYKRALSKIIQGTQQIATPSPVMRVAGYVASHSKEPERRSTSKPRPSTQDLHSFAGTSMTQTHNWAQEKSTTSSKAPTPTHAKSKATSHVDVVDPRKKSVSSVPAADPRGELRKSVSKTILDDDEKKRNASKDYRAPTPVDKSHGLTRDHSRNTFEKKASQANFYDEEAQARPSHSLYHPYAQKTEDHLKKSAQFTESAMIREKSQNRPEQPSAVDPRMRKTSTNKSPIYEANKSSYYFNQKRDSHAEVSGPEEHSFKGNTSGISAAAPKKKVDYPYFGGNENIYNHRAAYHAPSTATGSRSKSNTRQTIK